MRVFILIALLFSISTNAHADLTYCIDAMRNIVEVAKMYNRQAKICKSYRRGSRDYQRNQRLAQRIKTNLDNWGSYCFGVCPQRHWEYCGMTKDFYGACPD